MAARRTGTCNSGGCLEPTDINQRSGLPFYYCNVCREKTKAHKRKYYQKTKKRQNARTLAKWYELRDNFFSMYGDSCVCCGTEGHIFLALDHVKNNGKEHRAARGKFGVYEDAIARHSPELYQVLCHNCNFAKYQMGECPHRLVLEEKAHG